ncbi:MAG: leucine-rich repeat protein [Faecousia sp.]
MKQLFSILIALCLVLPLAVPAAAAENEGDLAAGTIGDFTWTLTGNTLTISGSGAMEDFTEDAPWLPYASQIQKVVFTGGVTYVASGAFADYDTITEVDFGDAMYELGKRSFYSCDGLTALYMPASFKVFGEDSLRACSKLTEIHCEGRFPSFRLNSLWDTYAKIYFPADRPWSVELIQQLEEAFHGRIEFLASDGTDPYVPAAETEPVTEAPTTQATEATTEATSAPTEETTQETTQPVTEETLPPTTAPTEAETTLPETTVPTETPPAESPSRYSPATLVLAAVVMVLCILGAGVLIIRSHRGGKYLD